MILKLAAAGILGILSLSKIIENRMQNYDTDVKEPIDSVSIIIPTLNEEQFVETCVKSLRNQSIIKTYPQYFEFILVDSGSTDRSVELARPYVDKIIRTPRGKLTSRNRAIDQSKGNIIVSVDSDTYYPPMWINSLLKPFNDVNNSDYNSNIVGVVGSTYDSYIPGIPTSIRNIAEVFDRYVAHPNQMVGRNSSFLKHGYYLAGRFDESVNQLDVSSMVREEEQDFGNRLSKLGNIVFKLNATCIHLGGQKIGCRLGTVDEQYCQKYGINIERFG